MRRPLLALGPSVLGLAAGCTSEPETPDTPPLGLERLETTRTPCPEQPDRAAAGAQTLPPLSFSDAAGDRVRVVGVISPDGVPQANSFAGDAGVTFPGAVDGDGVLMTALGLEALPFPSVLDAEGELAHTRVGDVASVDELRGPVAEHLGAQL